MKNKSLSLLAILCTLAISACDNPFTNTSSSNSSDSSPMSSLTVSSDSSSSSSEESSSEESSSSSEESSSEESSSSSEESSSSSSSSESSSDSSSSTPEVVLSTLEKLENGLANQDKIASGSIEKSELYSYSTIPNISNFEYEFGVDKYGPCTHVRKSDYSNYDYYYGYNASQNLYALQSNNGGAIEKPTEAVNTNFLKGYYITLFGYSESDRMYGAEGILNTMLGLAKVNANLDYTDLSTDNENKFRFNKYVDDYSKSLWEVTTTFTYENEAITSATVECVKYQNAIKDIELNTYYVEDGATPNQTVVFTISQTVGEKTYSNPYDIETLYFDSFDLLDANNNTVGDTLTIEKGSQYNLKIANASPSTAAAGVDKPVVREESGNISGSYNSYNGAIGLNCYSNPGEYDVVISTARVTKNIKVKVVLPKPNSMTITNYYMKNNNNGFTSYSVKDGVVEAYVGSDIYLEPSIEPYSADKSFTAEITSDNASNAEFELTSMKMNEYATPRDVYRISSNVAEAFTVKFTSSVNPDLTSEVTVLYKEAPELSSLLSKRYVNATRGIIYFDVTFTPNADDITTGIAHVSGVEIGEFEYNYSYDVDTRKFTLTDAEGTVEDINLFFNDNFELMNNLATLKEYSALVLIGGREFYTSDYNCLLMIYADGRVNFELYLGSVNIYLTLNCEVQEDNGVSSLVISDSSYEMLLSKDGVDAADKAFIISEDLKQITYSITINGEVHNLVYEA